MIRGAWRRATPTTPRVHPIGAPFSSSLEIDMTQPRPGDDQSAYKIIVKTHDGVQGIDPDAWDMLVDDGSPFLEHGFLSLLEETGCTGQRAGWIPMIFTAHRLSEDEPDDADGELIGALPFYIKTNSAGEFVFDWSWADAAQRAGIQYYPKAVVAVPFTPVTGRRILVGSWLDDDTHAGIRRALVETAVSVASQMGLSSVHFNFVLDDERGVFDDLQVPMRFGMQYHWYNGRQQGAEEDYADFDAFLSRFRSKRRANIRRERRKLAESGVTTRVVTGDALDEDIMARMYTFYADTVRKFYWGRQYLTEEFFLALPERMSERIHIVIASDPDGRDFAGAFNLVKRDRLYGRYWGCTREIKYTHFEVCMYKPIEWCIEHGIQVFEPGAGGEHKYERGFEPTRTTSAHYIADPGLDQAIRGFLVREREATASQIDHMLRESCLKD